jgi:hypothetical protein
LDENGTNYQDFNGTVCAKVDNNTSKLDFRDQNSSTATFKISKAIKDIRVDISWKKDVDGNCPLSNETNLTDNFAIRPDRFIIQDISSPIRAGSDFNIAFKAVDISDANVTDYDESNYINKSFEVNATEINSTCKTGDFNLSDFNFTDGNASNINATYSEVGEINITIQEDNNCSKRFAGVDCSDGDVLGHWTKDNNLSIEQNSTILTILPHHFEVNAILKDKYSDFTYLSRDLNMSAILDINITAQNKQNNTTLNYNENCYAKDANYTISYKPISNSLTKILYQDTNSPDINETDLNNPIILDINKSIFTTDTNGSANIELLINFDRNRSVGVNPFVLNITDINVTDVNDTNGSTSADNNATFYYGRVKTKDVTTNKNSIKHSLHVEVYRLGRYHQNSLNWYTNEDDNFTHIISLIPQASFIYNEGNNKSGLSVEQNSSLAISKGVADFDISNSWNNIDSSYIHVKIPSYLWYNSYEDYSDTNGSGCSSHPCFQYIYNSSGVTNGIQSGDFNGSSIGNDYNATKTKTGVKVFR